MLFAAGPPLIHSAGVQRFVLCILPIAKGGLVALVDLVGNGFQADPVHSRRGIGEIMVDD